MKYKPYVIDRGTWFAWYPVIIPNPDSYAWLCRVRWTKYRYGVGESAVEYTEYERMKEAD